jgi:hypothetical protein
VQHLILVRVEPRIFSTKAYAATLGEEINQCKSILFFSDAIDMKALTRISLDKCKNFVEEKSIRNVFNLKDDFDIWNSERDFGEEWAEKGYGFIDNPYFLQNNEEILIGNGDDDFNEFIEHGDGEIIIKSNHPNFTGIIDEIPHNAYYFKGDFEELSKNEFKERIEYDKDFELMIIELDID